MSNAYYLETKVVFISYIDDIIIKDNKKGERNEKSV